MHSFKYDHKIFKHNRGQLKNLMKLHLRNTPLPSIHIELFLLWLRGRNMKLMKSSQKWGAIYRVLDVHSNVGEVLHLESIKYLLSPRFLANFI